MKPATALAYESILDSYTPLDVKASSPMVQHVKHTDTSKRMTY